LALFNGSHYTLDAVRILGIGQILLGILATAFVAFGLVIWVIGFGVFNLIFGLYIYFNYERV
jgi:type IV secretory pathway TrbD component